MVGLTSVLVGLVLGRKFGSLSSVFVIVTALALVIFSLPRRLGAVIACITFGLAVGWWRGGSFVQDLKVYETLYGQQMKIEGNATSDGTYSENGQLGFNVDRLVVKEPGVVKLPGSIKVEAIGLPTVTRGDSLEIRGILYPAGGSRQGSIKFANTKILHKDSSFINTWRRKFVAGMQTALPEPHASFGLGLLIGQRTTLPEDLNDQLSTVGLTHIIAVSGYNLTIIVRSIGRLLGKRSKYQTMVCSILLITLFLLVTGFSASIVRAAIVSGLSLGAWYYGRKFRPLSILLLAAVITALWNPIYIWSDIGWHLSFLAFFGILILAPLIIKRFWKKEPRGLVSIALESASAIIMTAPLIMYIFEQTSVIALPSNMLIVPLVPLAMLLVLIAGIGGMMATNIAGWLAWPAQIILSYVLELVKLLSRIPHALVPVSISLPIMVALYVCICCICGLIWMKVKPKYGTLAPEAIRNDMDAKGQRALFQ
jgi:competence protein ComEC